jgi:hypothetical protein
LTAGSISFELGCQDWKDAPEVACKLEMGLAHGRVLTYRPDAPMAGPEADISIRESAEPDSPMLAEIRFARTFGGAPVVILAGDAIASATGR